MTLRALLPILLATLPSLAAPAEELPIPEALPAPVRALFDREIAKIAQRDWAVGQRVAGKVEAVAAPQVTPGEETDEVAIPIGTGLAISCTVAKERMDAGGWVHGVLAEVGKGVKLAAVRPVDMAVVAGSPLFFLDSLYVLEAKEGNQVGMLKIAVYAHDTHMFLCMHDEPGYRKSFRRIVGGFAEAMTGGEDERDGARYAEVASLRIGNVPVGFSETVHWDRKGGGTVARSTTTMMIPRSASELSTLDSFEEEEADAKELVVGGVYAESANGELTHKVTLARKADGKGFTVEGTKAGKALKGAFAAKDGLASDLWFARQFAAKAKPVAEVRHEVYSTSGDPLRAMAMTAKRVKGAARKVEITSEGLTYVAELDDAGQQIRAELPLGPIRLAVERIWLRGTP